MNKEDSKILSALKPLAEKAEKERTEALTKKREEAETGLAQVEKAEDASYEKLYAYQQKCYDAVVSAKKTLASATSAYEKANQVMRQKGHYFEVEKDRHFTFLTGTADPSIDEAQDYFSDEFNSAVGTKPTSQAYLGKKNLLSLTRITITRSNVEAIRERIAYCKSAKTELEKMKLKARCDFARIAELKNSIPSTDRFKEYHDGKPMESEATIRCSTVLGQVHERVSRLLKE